MAKKKEADDRKYHVFILVGGTWERHPDSPVSTPSRASVVQAFRGSQGQSRCGGVKVRRA